MMIFSQYQESKGGISRTGIFDYMKSYGYVVIRGKGEINKEDCDNLLFIDRDGDVLHIDPPLSGGYGYEIYCKLKTPFND